MQNVSLDASGVVISAPVSDVCVSTTREPRSVSATLDGDRIERARRGDARIRTRSMLELPEALARHAGIARRAGATAARCTTVGLIAVIFVGVPLFCVVGLPVLEAKGYFGHDGGDDAGATDVALSGSSTQANGGSRTASSQSASRQAASRSAAASSSARGGSSGGSSARGRKLLGAAIDRTSAAHGRSLEHARRLADARMFRERRAVRRTFAGR